MRLALLALMFIAACLACEVLDVSDNPRSKECTMEANEPCHTACRCYDFKIVTVAATGDEETTVVADVINKCKYGVSWIAFGTLGYKIVAPPNGAMIDGFRVVYTNTNGNPGFVSIKFESASQTFNSCGSRRFQFVLGGPVVRNGSLAVYTQRVAAHSGQVYEYMNATSDSNCGGERPMATTTAAATVSTAPPTDTCCTQPTSTPVTTLVPTPPAPLATTTAVPVGSSFAKKRQAAADGEETETETEESETDSESTGKGKGKGNSGAGPGKSRGDEMKNENGQTRAERLADKLARAMERQKERDEEDGEGSTPPTVSIDLEDGLCADVLSDSVAICQTDPAAPRVPVDDLISILNEDYALQLSSLEDAEETDSGMSTGAIVAIVIAALLALALLVGAVVAYAMRSRGSASQNAPVSRRGGYTSHRRSHRYSRTPF